MFLTSRDCWKAVRLRTEAGSNPSLTGSHSFLGLINERCVLRYIIINTGNWLAGRRVLVAPFAVMQVDRDNSKLHVTLTRNQVEKSPHIDTHQPVSRRMEAAYADYYG